MPSKIRKYINEHGENSFYNLLDTYGVGYTAKVLGYKSSECLRIQMKKEGLWEDFKK